MHTRALAAALIATCALLLPGAVAVAAPTEVTVRIEGKAKTLFEGPVLTDGHAIQAASDHTARPCDGTNSGANPTPGPTATAAAVDAMAIAGEDFDGRWFAGYEDYYVERWGPDRESYEGAGAFWGLLVGDALSSVGGCQLRLSAGDEEVLWAYDAFDPGRPFLRLAPAGKVPGGPVHVEVGEPLELLVSKRLHGGVLGVRPTLEPAAGVPVRLVSTDPGTRFQTPGATLEVSAADGSAEIAFASPGWRRLKAADDGDYVRSDRIDVCVRPAGGGGCGPPPPDAVLRVPPAAPPSGRGKGGGGEGGGRAPGPRGHPTRRAALDRLVRFLQNAQNADGGFGAGRGGASDPVFSAWAAYALAAAAINPLDQSRPGGVDVHTYLTRRTAGLRQTTDFDRVALVALASGTSPRDFGGVDAIRAILSRQLPDGSFPQLAGGRQGWVNATIWSIFPLSALEGPAAKAAVRRASAWLLAQQRPDGSWPSHSPGSGSDADMTGAAIQALNAAGRHDTAAEARAFEYLREAQGKDGGFAAAPGGGSNSATTAWSAQAIWSAGDDPREWRSGGGRDPLAYLASLQRADGSIGYTATSDLNSLWMTAQVGPALAGHAFPLPAVPRQAPAPERQGQRVAMKVDVLRAAVRSGQGGKRSRPGEGVIAGGGGRGAPLFSAPQPQSTGETRGGERELQAPSAGSPVEGLLLAGHPTAPGLLGTGSGGRREALPALLLVGAIGAAAAAGFRRGRLEAA